MNVIRTALAAFIVSAVSPATAHAHDYEIGDLRIVHPWAKASLKGAPNSAAYMAITNTGETSDRLIAASAPVSKAAELHAMSMTNGVMRMRRLEGGVPLPAGETIALKPGGKHIMLIGLKDQLEPGSSFSVTLNFENAGEHRIEVMVNDSEPEAAQDGG